MSQHRIARLAAVAVTVAAGAVATAAGAQAASQTVPLAPGQSTCISAPAGYQVRAEGAATGDGARFKLLRNGVVLQATPGRATSWAAELRTAYGNFPGAGSYAACAYNTGTRNTTVYLNLLVDSQF